MTWQEYQKAVSHLYKKMEVIGDPHHDIRIPDKITGQKRQVDVWWTMEVGGHTINILIDAKFNERPIDINDIDAVASLASSVSAHKAIVITNNRYTEPALKKATFIRILTLKKH